MHRRENALWERPSREEADNSMIKKERKKSFSPFLLRESITLIKGAILGNATANPSETRQDVGLAKCRVRHAYGALIAIRDKSARTARKSSSNAALRRVTARR